VDVRSTLIANGQAAHLVQVREGALHHPAVPSQTFTGVHSSPGNARLNASFTQCPACLAEVVSLVPVKLLRSAMGSAYAPADGRDGIDELLEDGDLVDIRRRELCCEDDALPLAEEVALAARTRSVRRIGPGFGAPPLARMIEASITARDQSRRSAPWSFSRMSRWSSSQTPAACQSRSLLQQVMPEPQPISCGSHSHWMPVLSTNRMPARQARSGIGGRPPFGRGRCRGRRGAIRLQSSSDTSGAAMPRASCKIQFC
jgi:hypothetical protein